MSDTEGQPDPDIRTEPLEGASDSPDRPESNKRDPDQSDETDRPRPDKDPETEEDTASGGPAD